jgi:ABC-2 type transport system ATP-binding protein
MRALSGGQKRRVLIAQALVHKPEVVVLDEPTAGVDVELRRTLWAFVRQMHKEGRTIVLTTHYLEEAEELCERIGIINRGKLVALDSKRALLARGIHQMRLRVTFADTPAGLPEPLTSLCASRNGPSIEFRLEHPQDIPGVLDAVRALPIGIVAIETAAPDLEDIFLTLTRGEVA